MLFALISARYEQRPLLITVDRLVNHAIPFELNVDSYHRRTVMDNKCSRGRPATRATLKTSHAVSPSDNDAMDPPYSPGKQR